MPSINSIPNGDEEINPRLDPDSDEFDSKFCVKNLRKLYNSDPSFYKRSSLGVKTSEHMVLPRMLIIKLRSQMEFTS